MLHRNILISIGVTTQWSLNLETQLLIILIYNSRSDLVIFEERNFSWSVWDCVWKCESWELSDAKGVGDEYRPNFNPACSIKDALNILLFLFGSVIVK